MCDFLKDFKFPASILSLVFYTNTIRSGLSPLSLSIQIVYSFSAIFPINYNDI